MKYDANKQSARAELAKLRALYGPDTLTPEELAEHKRLVAREIARAEARRSAAQPELEIE